MKKYYCWRCERELPFLDEDEWAEMLPSLNDARGHFMDKYEDKLWQEREKRQQIAVSKFEELTGEPNMTFNAIEHHLLSEWGGECKECHELLRTSRAKFCASCGKKI